MNNNLLTIQETIMREIDRLDNCNGDDMSSEVARSNALSNSAMTFIKSVNVQLRVKEIAERTQVTTDSINSELGIVSE